MTADQIKLIELWEVTSQQLAELKRIESELRVKVIAAMFDADKAKGTQHVPLANGWKLTCVKGENYTLNNSGGKVEAALDALTKAGANPPDNIVRWKPELTVAAYENLKPEHKAFFNECLTIKPAMPQLSLVAPKVKET